MWLIFLPTPWQVGKVFRARNKSHFANPVKPDEVGMGTQNRGLRELVVCELRLTNNIYFLNEGPSCTQMYCIEHTVRSGDSFIVVVSSLALVALMCSMCSSIFPKNRIVWGGRRYEKVQLKKFPSVIAVILKCFSRDHSCTPHITHNTVAYNVTICAHHNI